MPGATDFAKMVPGFDFLQGLMKGAGNAVPNMSQWIAPTLNPEELEKRIQELRTVQFWLEQNAKLLGATIQALEVQRMTLSTLKSMNLPMTELRESLKLRMPEPAPAPEPEPAPAPVARKAAPKPARKPAAAPVAGAVDPMQWWGALTQQFTELAANALKDGAADAAKAGAGVAEAGSAAAQPAAAPARSRARVARRKAG